MELASRLPDVDTERTLFSIGAIIAAALTVLVFLSGAQLVHGLLFLAFTLYLLGAALPQVHGRVPEYNRTAAIALGGIGLIAYFAGTASTLPLLFILAGVAALLGLW